LIFSFVLGFEEEEEKQRKREGLGFSTLSK